MTKQNPVTYAEQVLGVHAPWQEVQERLSNHAAASESADETAIQLRATRRELEDRKRNITNLAPQSVNWPDKVTPQKEFIKRAIDNDEECLRLERSIEELQAAHDEYKSTARHHELGIHALSARMTELGGLLTFYSEVKRAETTSQISPNKSNTQEEGTA